MKIVTVLGARPQFIKASVVSNIIKQTDSLNEIMIHTGQHFNENMSEVFFTELKIQKPAYNLGINGGTHGEMTGRMLIEIEKILLIEKPDAVLIYGDTNSTLAGALASVKLHIPVAHVEAGLRSFNFSMPEEINRILTDRISHWLFTPTKIATQHLAHEGVNGDKILQVGDVMYDAALYHGAGVTAESGLLHKLGIRSKKYILATVHRAENTDNIIRMTNILSALNEVVNDYPVILPLHPRTRSILQQNSILNNLARNINIIKPVSYLNMIQLEKYAALIATDSGGVQKEAFFFSVPCVTLRDETEWIELVNAGWNRIASPTDANILREIIRSSIGSLGEKINPYGDGDASEKIVKQLLNS